MFKIEFTSGADRHLDAFEKGDQKSIVDTIVEHLSYEPAVPTRNRKQLRPNDLAEWEFRLDRFRIFYDIDGKSQIVTIVAIGLKERDRLIIGGKDFQL